MRKKTVTRLQLLALFLVTGLVLFRVFSGPPAPSGTVTINKIKPSSLKSTSFDLSRPVVFAISAAGSHPNQERTDAEDLAAYAWILNRNSGNVVWKMQGAPIATDQTLASVTDTLELPAGSYNAYFTSYGNLPESSQRRQIFGVAIGNQWMSDSEEWHFVMHVVDKADEEAVTIVDREAHPAEDPTIIWSTGPVKRAGTQQFVFNVDDTVDLEIEAVGEYCKSGCDYGAITDYITGDTLWQMSLLNTQPAGGMQENISFDGTVNLQAGTYRAFFESDYGHYFGGWEANPPYYPEKWGMTMRSASASDAQHVNKFDPWLQREPLISITRVESNRQEGVAFQVHDTTSVLVYAMGELTSSGSSYDYAFVKDVSTGEKVWAMSYLASEHAGGDETNRLEVAVLTLMPGRYELGYQSDSSHDFGHFSNGEPENPERWGVTMFPLATGFTGDEITVLQPETAVEHPVDSFDFELDAGQVIFNATQLGNNERVSQSFTIDGLTIIRIVATGEISTSGQYDYGWIEDQDTGSVVWEMTRRNTTHAGGDDHNRRFEGLVELKPGKYTGHFKTDFTHAFNDFGDGGPDNPADWGIRVEKILSND